MVSHHPQENLYQEFLVEVKKHPPLSREKEREIARGLWFARQRMLFYLSRFPPFFLHLSTLKRELRTRRKDYHAVFHMKRSEKDLLKKGKATEFLIRSLTLLEERVKCWTIEWEEHCQDMAFCLQRANRWGEEIRTYLRALHLTQDFINAFVDELPPGIAWLGDKQAQPALPRQYLEKICSQLRTARKRYLEFASLLVKSNLRLVINIAKHYASHNVAFTDILQEGNLGLMKAVDRFDYRRGTRFSTYATWWIRQSINRTIVHRDRIIRIPSHLAEKFKRIQRSITKMQRYLGREPTWSEIAAEHCQSVNSIYFLFSLNQKPFSLDNTEDSSESNSELYQLIPDHTVEDPVDIITEMRLRDEVNLLLKTLSAREQKVLQLRFGIDKDRKYTLEEVGDCLGVTRERIRQIEIRALKKLKHPSRASRLATYYHR